MSRKNSKSDKPALWLHIVSETDRHRLLVRVGKDGHR